MTPKAKALELVSKYNSLVAKNTKFTSDSELKKSKQFALIAVDEILNIENVKPYILHKEIINYYTKVKNEINKL